MREYQEPTINPLGISASDRLGDSIPLEIDLIYLFA